eukprot:5722211-Pleurochrysis_carterae.AAC.2
MVSIRAQRLTCGSNDFCAQFVQNLKTIAHQLIVRAAGSDQPLPPGGYARARVGWRAPLLGDWVRA